MANSSEYICLPSGLSLTEFKVFHTSFCTDFCCRKRGRRELYGDNVVVVANYCRVDLLLNCMVAVSRKVDDFCKTTSYFIVYTYTHTYIHVLKSRLRWLILQYHRYLIYFISWNEATNVTQFVSRRIFILSSFIIMLGQFCDCRTNLKRMDINKFHILLYDRGTILG